MAFGAREQAIFKFARGQHGLVTYAQLAEAGATRRMVSLRLKSGEWIRELPTVVRMHWAERTWMEQLWAAWLWAGPRSVISHASAAALNGLGVGMCEPIHVTMPRIHRANAPTEWMTVYASRSIQARDFEILCGLPVMTPARTVIDMASQLSETELSRLVRSGQRVGVVAVKDIQKYFTQHRTRGRIGMKTLRAVLRTASL